MTIAPSSEELRIYAGSTAFASFEAQRLGEKEFDALCVRYGLHRWASGKDMVSGIRDIAYDKHVPEEET